MAAFLGLSAVETFHHHQANQTAASCSVCQIAQSTPAHLSPASVIGPHTTSTRTPAIAAPQPYIQFVLVAHGLSPPAL